MKESRGKKLVLKLGRAGSAGPHVPFGWTKAGFAGRKPSAVARQPTSTVLGSGSPRFHSLLICGARLDLYHNALPLARQAGVAGGVCFHGQRPY